MVTPECYGEGCLDDLCRGSGTCLVKGWRLGERCPSCGVVYNPSEGEDCDCDPYDDYYEYYGPDEG